MRTMQSKEWWDEHIGNSWWAQHPYPLTPHPWAWLKANTQCSPCLQAPPSRTTPSCPLTIGETLVCFPHILMFVDSLFFLRTPLSCHEAALPAPPPASPRGTQPGASLCHPNILRGGVVVCGARRACLESKSTIYSKRISLPASRCEIFPKCIMSGFL